MNLSRISIGASSSTIVWFLLLMVTTFVYDNSDVHVAVTANSSASSLLSSSKARLQTSPSLHQQHRKRPLSLTDSECNGHHRFEKRCVLAHGTTNHIQQQQQEQQEQQQHYDIMLEEDKDEQVEEDSAKTGVVSCCTYGPKNNNCNSNHLLSPVLLFLASNRGGGGQTVSTQDSSSPTDNCTTTGLKQRLKIGFYFGLWYALNVIYNIMNKKLLNIIPAPVTVGTIQLGIGGLYAILLWLTRLRASPKLTPKGKEIVWKVGAYHGSGQLFSMVSLGAGPVSFTHIVKALEPFFSAMISGLVFGKWMKPQVYATLIPVVGGVGYACLKERSFSWLAFWMAMLSNLSFALRAVVSKTGMNHENYIGENMNAVNLFAVVTLTAFVLCIPVAWIVENGLFMDLWTKATATTATATGTTANDLIKAIILSGLFHYLNNEVMYLALSNVHPVTLAVGNTMKRVFIMVASVLVFRNPVSLQAGIGSTIGISGVLLYSLTKQYYENLERSQLVEAAPAAAAVKATRKKETSFGKKVRNRGRA